MHYRLKKSIENCMIIKVGTTSRQCR